MAGFVAALRLAASTNPIERMGAALAKAKVPRNTPAAPAKLESQGNRGIFTARASMELSASKEGRLGPGVYLVESWELAATIARHRGHDGNACVVVCECSDRAPKIGMHPAWAGIPKPFKEYCCREDCIRVVAVELVDKHTKAPNRL
ncbi:unnamed protein product [Symbiodinium natans]|uniref:Uncharacterized protein n=1 Tax=Symbiodinium natans TaxID=878477 RepID=A0A812NY14_9DINO|nr:unnamed protein product [Symbiodinium natans]